MRASAAIDYACIADRSAEEGERMKKRQQGMKDDNLRNVVSELEQEPANSHQAQQLQQDTNDRRHQDALNHEE